MKCFGLTGGIGSGKSEAVRLLREKGIAVVDADELAHLVTASGTPGLEAIVKHFGKDFLNDKNELDRKKLGSYIFSNLHARKDLEKIVHPLIHQKRQEILRAFEMNGANFCILSAPLIFENNIEKELDGTILIVADSDIRIERVAKRDGISKDQIQQRMNAQMSDEEKIKRASEVIYNNGSREELAHSLWKALKHLTGTELSHM